MLKLLLLALSIETIELPCHADVLPSKLVAFFGAHYLINTIDCSVVILLKAVQELLELNHLLERLLRDDGVLVLNNDADGAEFLLVGEQELTLLLRFQ